MKRSNFLNRSWIFASCIKDYFFKKDRVSKYPHTLIIETTNHCNLSCKMCFHKKMKRKKGFLSKKTMKILLNNLRNYKIPHVQLAFGGEPFLHPKILDYIKEFKKLDIKVEIFTNGLLVNKDISNKIIDLELDIINFSIDSTNNKTYSKIRRGGNLNIAFKNLKYLSKLKKQLKVKKPFIRLCVTKVKDNRLEIRNNLFKKKYGKYVDYIYYNYENNWIGSVNNEVIIGKRGVEERDRICLFPWLLMAITHDGKVVPCCCDYDINYQIGDIHKETLGQIRHIKRLRDIRQALIKRDYDSIRICKKCLWRKHNSPFKLLFNRIKSEIVDLIHLK